MLYEKINQLCEGDIFELFGNSGSGKTTFAFEVIKEFVTRKKKVLVIDTEKNYLKAPEGIDYKYFADFDEIAKYVENIPKGYDLIVLDSIGMPVLGKFSKLDARGRGDILLKGEGICYDLKLYCQRNKSMAIVINQPESAFGKSIYHISRPFLDKSIYFFKEIWKTRLSKQEPDITICKIEAFRSRSWGRKTLLFEMTIKKDGVKIECKI